MPTKTGSPNQTVKELTEADAKASKFYEAQAPWYERTTAHWLTSAKRQETRDRRLATLIDCCRSGKKLPALDR